ncbi:hypothetical protein OV079_16160 [Nannocystis pusilla]|uniref:Uncharacterized protein n=1 Tax=Nannocystis pusilla TaxID=889268 RepID=A0A9X3IYN6_9BACT|nr:hypothetical protein [Nannocystis pusilla]MCY1007063.1 hypothetical protein [Nannocystis pusilla]
MRFEEADVEEQGGHAFLVMDRYVAWFEADEAGRQAMALLRLMGLFDRPAADPVFTSLLAEPVIVGWTEAAAGLSEVQRNVALKRLKAVQLLTVEREGQTQVAYDAHPLVREYFAQRLQETRGEAWRAGHRRLFEYLRASVAPTGDPQGAAAALPGGGSRLLGGAGPRGLRRGAQRPHSPRDGPWRLLQR